MKLFVVKVLDLNPIWFKVNILIEMLDRPRSALEKLKNSIKTHTIQYGGQTVRLTGKSYKKPNDLHEISYL